MVIGLLPSRQEESKGSLDLTAPDLEGNLICGYLYREDALWIGKILDALILQRSINLDKCHLFSKSGHLQIAICLSLVSS